jgi:RimJ/RimL family protein N-acetyltransferase
MYSGSLVRLRAPEPRDAETFHAWFNDPEVTATLGVRYPRSMAATREWVERSAVATYGNCHFAVDTLDGVPIGMCGLYEAALPENRCAQLGVTIGDKAYWGRGYGADTVRTLCRFGFGEMNLHRIELLVFAHHAVARRLYVNLGFVEEAVAREAHWGNAAWWDDVYMSLLEGELR